MSPRNSRRRSAVALFWILGGAAAIGIYVASGPLLVNYLIDHPSHGLWVGLSGYLTALPGALWGYGLALRRARWARKNGVPAREAAREWTSTRWEGVASGALMVAGGAITFAAMGIEDRSGDAPAGVVGGVFVGGVLVLGPIMLLHLALVARPAKENTMLLLGDPLLVTQIAPPEGDGHFPIRVVYCARFRLGPRAFVEMDGRRIGELTPGGAIGTRASAGKHLVTVSDASGARPLRMEVEAARGQVTTVATTMFGAAMAFTDRVVSSAEFIAQNPDRSSPMVGVASVATRSLGTPIATTVAATSSAEPGDRTSDAVAKRSPVDASAVAMPIEILAEEASDPTPAEAPSSGTGAPQRGWAPAVVTVFAAVAVGASAVATLLPAAWESVGNASGSARPMGVFFFSQFLIIVALPLEIRRATGFAPPRRYPASLVLLAIGAAALGGNLALLTLADWRSTASSVLFVFAVVLVFASVPWFLDRRYGVRFRSRRAHFARQRAWRAQPRAVERFAGEARAGWGAIRVSVSSTVKADFLFGVDSQAARYEIAESEAVGLYVRAGTQTIQAVHSSGLAARFEVEVMNGAVTPVEFGAPARRFLWLVPRQRALYARVGAPESGPLLLASG